jgi:KDO II ethanolaminephosphotransferase
MLLRSIKAIPISQWALSTILAVYIGCILNAVNLYRAYTSGGIHDGILIAHYAVAMTFFSLFVLEFSAIFGIWFYKLLAALLLIFSATASFYMIFYNVVVGYGVIASVFQVTDVKFAGESVSYGLFVWTFFVGVLPALLITHINVRKRFWHNIRRPAAGLLTIALLFGAVFITTQTTKNVDKVAKKAFSGQDKYTAVPSGIMTSSFVPTNWLSGLIMYGYQEFGGNQTELDNPAELFEYSAPASLDDTYVVFILGETTRGDHMQILGYDRETNPLLANEKNLVAFQGRSCDTATLLSMRCMFVREGAASTEQHREVSENNVFYVLNQLGFSVELFAMQSEVWFYNTIGASSYEIREALGAAHDVNKTNFDDMVLIDYMNTSISRHPKGKHVVFLHTKGSHNTYSQRYPREFAHFLPECLSINDSCSVESLINSFDNSVRYVDLFLDTIFEELKDKKAIVFYASDHGESIAENRHFHATPKEIAPEEQFNIPILVWASDKYLEVPNNQQLFSNLQRRQKNNPEAKHEDIYDSILGCLGYTSGDGGLDPNNNWCNE